MEAPGAANTTVVIAVRDRAVRTRFEAALRQAGHAVVSLDEASRVLDCVTGTGHGPALLLLDLDLDARGIELLERVRAALPRAAIAIFSGSLRGAADARSLAALGIDTYVNEYSDTLQILEDLTPRLFPARFDRRISPRIALAIPVTFSTGGAPATAMTFNLSRGGLGIRTVVPPATGTLIHVRFRLPHAPDEIEVDARVVWRDSHSGMGVQFEKIDAHAQSAIDAFVERVREAAPARSASRRPEPTARGG